MSLLSVVQDVCAVVGVARPVSVFAAIGSNRTMQEMVALANEMAQRIAYDTRDWQKLQPTRPCRRRQCVPPQPTRRLDRHDGLPAAGQLQAHAADVQRLALDLDATADALRLRYRRVARAARMRNAATRLGRVDHARRPDAHLPGRCAVGVRPPTFAYLDKNCVALASGGYGDRFHGRRRQFRLDERLLKLGMIWQWKAKGLALRRGHGHLQDAMTNAMGHDKPAPILVVGAAMPIVNVPPPSGRGGPAAVFNVALEGPQGPPGPGYPGEQGPRVTRARRGRRARRATPAPTAQFPARRGRKATRACPGP